MNRTQKISSKFLLISLLTINNFYAAVHKEDHKKQELADKKIKQELREALQLPEQPGKRKNLSCMVTSVIANYEISHECRMTILTSLLDAGAETNEQTYFSHSPLKKAIEMSENETEAVDLVKLLLPKEQNINMVSGFMQKETPLVAAWNKQFDTVVQLLIEAKAGLRMHPNDDENKTVSSRALQDVTHLISQMAISNEANMKKTKKKKHKNKKKTSTTTTTE